MPHFWNNILVVTREELIPEWWSNWENLKKEIYRYKDLNYGIKKVQIGGNGRLMLISFDSLPKHVQEGLGDPRKVNHILERYYKRKLITVEFYSNFQFEDQSTIKREVQEVYVTNATVLEALIELEAARIVERRTKGGTTRGILKTIHEDALSFQETLMVKYGISHTLPKDSRWFNKVYKSFKKDGYITLIKDIKRVSSKNARKLEDFTTQFLNNLFATQQHKPTATEVWQQYNGFLDGYIEVINNNTGEIYDPKGMPNLSKSTVKNWLASWQSSIVTYHKRSKDRQKLTSKFKPYHSLKAPKFAGSIISIDDRQPPFEYAPGKRMWFYVGIDLASEAFVCWVWGKSKAGIILEFYRQLVRNYAEWGFSLPYELEAESSLNSSFKDTFLKEGVLFQEVRIEANNARGKRIEAYFKPLRYELEKKREGWLARPFAKSESNQPKTDKKKIIPIEEIVEGCLRDIEIWNNTEHSRDKGGTRWKYLKENQNPNLRPINYKAILPQLGFRTPTSCKVGSIRLQNGEYLLGDENGVAKGEQLIDLLIKVEGKELDVYWLDDNNGEVLKALVFLRGQTQFICEAVPKPKYSRAVVEQTEEDKQARSIMSSYVTTFEAFKKRGTKAIDDLTVIDNRPLTLNDDFKIKSVNTVDLDEVEEPNVIQEDFRPDFDQIDEDQEFFTPKILEEDQEESELRQVDEESDSLYDSIDEDQEFWKPLSERIKEFREGNN